ncbi:transglutaminase-like cysteine peptidase, partial [Methylobacterium sp.]
MRSPIIALGLAALGALIAPPAAAQALPSLPEPSVGAAPLGPAKPLVAWVAFCEAYAAECAVDPSEPARIALTAQVWASVVSVNRRV